MIAPFPDKVLKAETVIVSCGQMKFEESNYANRTCSYYRDWMGQNSTEIRHFTKHPKGCGIFLESFRKVFPTLCGGRNIILIDCTGFSDPQRDRSLCKHIGHHPEILRGVVDADNFTAVNYPLENLKFGQKNLVINACKSGNHRAVANKKAQSPVISRNLYEDKERASPLTFRQNHIGDICAGITVRIATMIIRSSSG